MTYQAQKQAGFFLMVVSAVGLAVAAITMKLLLQSEQLSPAQIAVWRFTLAAPLMWAVVLWRKPQYGLSHKEIYLLLGLGVVYALASFAALFALDRLPSSLYAIIVYTYPTLIVIYSLFTGRSVPRLFWLGIPLTLIGLVLLSYCFDTLLSINLIGVGITLINAALMAIYLIRSEIIFKDHPDRLLGTAWVMTGAMFFSWIAIPFAGIRTPASLSGWMLLVTFGVFGTLMPILAMNIGVQMVGAARGSLIIVLQPVMTVLFSMIFLQEMLSPLQWIGSLFILIAVVLLQQSGDRQGGGQSQPANRNKRVESFPGGEADE